MLKKRSTIQQIRVYLYKEIRNIYPDGESMSIVRHIMDHMGYPAEECLRNPNRESDSVTISQINEIVTEIHTSKPIQQILGYTYFCDLKIEVNRNVLIPRPETEEMVYLIMDQISQPPLRILDLGTGSGCIALALKNRFPDALVTGLDVSQVVLDVATRNAKKNGLEINWIKGDIHNENLLVDKEGYDLIISNPPYVLWGEAVEMEPNVLRFEPGSALFVEDEEPLINYHAIARICQTNLIEGGILWVEINERFGSETASLFQNAGMKKVTTLNDIHGKERFINARR